MRWGISHCGSLEFDGQMTSSSSTNVGVGLRSVDGGGVTGGDSWASVGLATGDMGALTGEGGGDGEAWTGGDGDNGEAMVSSSALWYAAVGLDDREVRGE